MHLVDEIAGSTTADVVDRGCVLSQALLLGQLFIKAEHGALLLAVDVASTATAGGEESIGRWRRERKERGRTGGSGTGSRGLGVDAGDVASSSPARVVDVGGRNGGVRLGDLVARHCGGVLLY